MVIKRLEKRLQLEEFLEQGGSVREEKKKMEWTKIVLRIRKDLLDDVKVALEDRIGMSTTAWISEAIQEKLKKD